MATRQCVITKWDGDRCENLIDSEDGYLCSRHLLQYQKSKDDKVFKMTFEQIERGVKFAGTTAGLIGGIIKIVEFVANNWDTFYGSVGSVERRESESERLEHEATKRIIDSTYKIQEQCQLLLHSDLTSPEDLQELSVSFSDWFDSLPADVRRDAKRNFGELYFEAVRKLS